MYHGLIFMLETSYSSSHPWTLKTDNRRVELPKNVSTRALASAFALMPYQSEFSELLSSLTRDIPVEDVQKEVIQVIERSIMNDSPIPISHELIRVIVNGVTVTTTLPWMDFVRIVVSAFNVQDEIIAQTVGDHVRKLITNPQ